MTRSSSWASTKNLPFVVKLDLNGFFVWGKYYDFPKDLSSSTENISCSIAYDKRSLIIAAELNNLKLFEVDLELGSIKKVTGFKVELGSPPKLALTE